MGKKCLFLIHYLYLHECSDPVSSFFISVRQTAAVVLFGVPLLQETKREAQAPLTVYFIIDEKSWSFYSFRLHLCFQMSATGWKINKQTNLFFSPVSCFQHWPQWMPREKTMRIFSFYILSHWVLLLTVLSAKVLLLVYLNYCLTISGFLFLISKKKWKFFPPYLLYTSHDNELLLFLIQLSLFQALLSLLHNVLPYFSSPFFKSFEVLL